MQIVQQGVKYPDLRAKAWGFTSTGEKAVKKMDWTQKMLTFVGLVVAVWGTIVYGVELFSAILDFVIAAMAMGIYFFLAACFVWGGARIVATNTENPIAVRIDYFLTRKVLLPSAHLFFTWLANFLTTGEIHLCDLGKTKTKGKAGRKTSRRKAQPVAASEPVPGTGETQANDTAQNDGVVGD